MATPYYLPPDKVPLPPPDAKVFTTACDYCIVGCGYKVYRWPLGREGGPKAYENAFGVDFPSDVLHGKWPSTNMHNIVMANGKPHHVIVIPDADIQVVNIMGDHSIRGGAIAQKCYNPGKPTRDRLKQPMIRVHDLLYPVSWDLALDVMAEVSKYVLKKYGAHSWAMRMYSYQYFENTYALTKLVLRYIKTPAYAHHDKPTGTGSDTPGLRDAGIDPFSASYEDWSQADVLFISGTDPYETKTVMFNAWIMKGIAKGMKLIYALPRKTSGVVYGEKYGGLALILYPGTDTILQLALARIILLNGWEDKEWLSKNIANKWEIESGFGQGTRNTPWQWRTTWDKFGTDLEGYKRWILGYKYAELKTASEITGVPANQIERAAEMLTKPIEGKRPKASFMLEKGNYWSNNYLNTASLAALGLLCGAGNRPGQVISRGGGHQRGMMPGGRYPIEKSPEKYPGRRRKALDLDRWVKGGNVRFAWCVGTTWLQAMGGTTSLIDTFNRMTRLNPNQVKSLDKDHIIEVLKKRADSGGMVLVDQDIYPVDPLGTKYADIVLPAATWGEENFSRANGERRIRLYQKFYDPPGKAKPDWWIAAQFAKKMGFEGFDWKDSNDVFEEAARFGRARRTNYHPLVWLAKRTGKKGHDLLREYGTTGIQGPIRYEDGRLVGTKRLHDETLKLGTPQGPTVHMKWLTKFNS
ncbi:MAG: arsenate reductase (azurin) large subunit, partial [Thermodesulfobacteriota bacterium]